MQTVNLSANEVLEHLNIKLPATWSAEANEIDTVCFDHKDVGLFNSVIWLIRHFPVTLQTV